MKMYLISDNIDTLTGMRLAGVEGVIAHERQEVKAALDGVLLQKDIGILLMTEFLGKKYPDLVKAVRTEHKRPLLIEIPDRHGTGRRPDFITAYVNEAIGLKL
ncbi:MAG: ATP synthase subunit F [Lachnospiraceae bacterium]|nr:ATP synthase subunit F [Lachnospiraceae bacterium]